MPIEPALDDRLKAWAADQRALARALGLSIEEWLAALDQASERRVGLTAAVAGAAMAGGLGLAVLDQLDAPGLIARARALIDPRPPKVESPVLAEAIRRADELAPTGRGRALLGARSPSRPRQALPSDTHATSDAPGEEEGK